MKVFFQIMFCYLVLIHCYSPSVIDAVSFVLTSRVDVARLCRMRHCYLSVPPLMWNSLPATIEQVTRYGQFRQHLKTHFWEPRNRSALWLLIIARCTNTLTYLLTHLLMKQTNAQTQTQHRRKCPKHSDAKNQFLRLYLLFVYGFLMQTTRLPRAVWNWLIYCSFVCRCSLDLLTLHTRVELCILQVHDVYQKELAARNSKFLTQINSIRFWLRLFCLLTQNKTRMRVIAASPYWLLKSAGTEGDYGHFRSLI